MPTADEVTADWLLAQWAIPAAEHRVEVEGASIAYRAWNREATALPGLILVHGFRAHARWWDHIAPSLAASHRVAAIDLSGMGDSDRRARYSRAQMAREVLAVAADCGFAPVTLVAHSFGAMAAIMAAIAAPERVQRLVIIADAIAAARAPPLHRDAAPLSARRRHRRGQPGRGRLWRDRTFPSPSAARGMTPCCQRRMP